MPAMNLPPTLKRTLLELFLAVPRQLATPAYAASRRFLFRDHRAPFFDQAFRAIAASGLQGDYLEFGVFRGTSFIMAHNLARKHGLDAMRFFAFDSFAGLPETEGSFFQEGDMVCTKDLFTRIISHAGVDLNRVSIFPGLFNESLTEELKVAAKLREAAIVHVDCDLYRSTVDVLRFVDSLVRPSTVVIFDDWSWFLDVDPKGEQHGEPRAFNEWPRHTHFEPLYESGGTKAVIYKPPAT